MSTVYVGYNPGDFFYKNINQADVSGTSYHLKPTKEECDVLYANPKFDSSKINNTCSVWFSDNSLNCIKYRLCANEEDVNYINELEDTHNSRYGKNTANQEELSNTLLNTLNLAIGIVFIFFMIYKMQKIVKNQKS